MIMDNLLAMCKAINTLTAAHIAEIAAIEGRIMIVRESRGVDDLSLAKFLNMPALDRFCIPGELEINQHTRTRLHSHQEFTSLIPLNGEL